MSKERRPGRAATRGFVGYDHNYQNDDTPLGVVSGAIWEAERREQRRNSLLDKITGLNGFADGKEPIRLK